MGDSSRLSGLVVVVTGAAFGIGRATALQLANDGATVVAADIDADGARSTVARAKDLSLDMRAQAVNITDSESIAELCSSVRDIEGRCDVLVNNAGWEKIAPFRDTSLELRERIIALNLLGPINVTHAFLDGMIERRKGTIVNISSDAGRVGSSGETVYAGAKGGVVAFTKSLAREVARYGISVNCICPGPTNTDAFGRVPEKLRASLIRAIPLRRVAQPEDIANAISFFSSPRSSYITGQVLSVDGGLTMVD